MASIVGILQGLNNIAVGRLDHILKRLNLAIQELMELGHDELADKLLEARSALLSGDETLFQKRVSHVTSKLGHLK